MGADILPLPHVPRPDMGLSVQPQAHIIERLECLLESARSGEVQALAVATVRNDETVATSVHKGPHMNILLAGAVAILFHDTMSKA